MVYLKSDVKTLKNRINKRGRDMENGITVEYLKSLQD